MSKELTQVEQLIQQGLNEAERRGFEMAMTAQREKYEALYAHPAKPYTGKKRGPKPKAKEETGFTATSNTGLVPVENGIVAKANAPKRKYETKKAKIGRKPRVHANGELGLATVA